MSKIFLAIGALGLAACSATEEPSTEMFLEAGPETGFDFLHVNGRTGEFYYPEIVGPGAAFFDYDNDDDLDVYVVQGGALDPATGAGAFDAAGDQLFRNDLEIGADGTPRLHFVDVTAEAGLSANGFGMGVAVGDIDNDGWADLYLTNFGANELWRNRGDGTFELLPEAAGAAEEHWSISAAFLDYDRDGWLDLYVVNYLNYQLSDRRKCTSATGRREYCGPQNFEGERDTLFRNRGDGTFENVSGPAGILSEAGASLGVATADFNGDGWLDIYVANDLMPNTLWINRGDGTFSNDALLSGSALSVQGQAEASMGVDAADFDNDGDVDIFLTHLAGETNTLYVNDGMGLFNDRSVQTGVGSPSMPSTGFGTALLDFDNDGWLDIVAANGAVHLVEELARSGDPYPFHQPNQLFRNLGDGRFEDVTAAAGRAFQRSEISRGTAVGDIDNDGDPDVLVMNVAAPARLLLNQVGSSNPWLGLRLLDAERRSDQIGASLFVKRRSGRVELRRARSDGSYGSANDPRVLIAVEDVAEIEALEVVWPSGKRERWSDLSRFEIGRYHGLIEGEGESVEGPVS